MEEINLFDRNIELLKKNNPQLADLVLACPDASEEELDCQIVNGRETTVSVNGVQLTSRHDGLLQMQQMCDDLNPNVREVEVYGHGLGDIGNYLLDNYKDITRINFHILNLSLFKILLSVVDFPLDNPKIKWIYKKDSWVVRHPNIIYYPEVLMCDEPNRRLAEHLEGHLDLSYSKESYETRKDEVVAQIKENIHYIKTGQDVTKLFNKAKGKKAVVVSPGPSLESSIEKVKQLRADPDYVIIAVDTASKFLHEQNVRIDYLVSIDHKNGKNEILSSFDKTEVLVYAPSIKPELIKLFDKSYIFYCDNATFRQFDSINRHGRLFCSGTVSHCAVDLAVRMGMKEVILFGYDFAFLNNVTHAGYHDQLSKLLIILDDQETVEIKGTCGDILSTTKSFRFFLQDLEIYISRHPNVKFYNASKTGALIGGTLNYDC